MTLLRKSHVPRACISFLFYFGERGELFLGRKRISRGLLERGVSLSWFFPSLWRDMASSSLGMLWVCVGTRTCAVNCLFIWLCLNLAQDVLGNHSELDKQKIVTLALYFTVSVVAIVRKAQGVERRWVR